LSSISIIWSETSCHNYWHMEKYCFTIHNHLRLDFCPLVTSQHCHCSLIALTYSFNFSELNCKWTNSLTDPLTDCTDLLPTCLLCSAVNWTELNKTSTSQLLLYQHNPPLCHWGLNGDSSKFVGDLDLCHQLSTFLNCTDVTRGMHKPHSVILPAFSSHDNMIWQKWWGCHRICDENCATWCSYHEENSVTWWGCCRTLWERQCHVVWLSCAEWNGATPWSCHRIYEESVFPPKIHRVLFFRVLVLSALTFWQHGKNDYK
jgi:hypothetical protein